MQVQVNTGHHIESSESFVDCVRSTVEASLGRFEQLTRIEVHLSDDNADKSNGDASAVCRKPVPPACSRSS